MPRKKQLRIMLRKYKINGGFDEMLDGNSGVRSHYRKFHKLFKGVKPAEFDAKRQTVDTAFLRQGITFNVYGDAQGAEKDFPVRPAAAHHPGDGMGHLERGLAQRITALNLFLHDIYHEQKILKDGVIPEFYVLSARHFRREFVNFRGARRRFTSTSAARI